MYMYMYVYIYIYIGASSAWSSTSASALRKHNSARRRECARIMLPQCPEYGFVFWGGDSIMREYRGSRVLLLNPRYVLGLQCSMIQTYIYIYIYVYYIMNDSSTNKQGTFLGFLRTGVRGKYQIQHGDIYYYYYYYHYYDC